MKRAYRAINIGSHLSISKEITGGHICLIYCNCQYIVTLRRKASRAHKLYFFYHLIVGQVRKSLVIEKFWKGTQKKLNSYCLMKGQGSGREEKLTFHFKSRSHSWSFFAVRFF